MKSAPRTVALPLAHTRALVRSESIDPAHRTVDLVWSTGARVRRMGWDGPWIEELSLADDAVDLARLNGGANLLAAHNAHALGGILGVVESARLETTPTGARVGVARVRFSERADVEPVWSDVAAGIIRHVSVGYIVHKLEEIDAGNARSGEPPVFRATRWEPVEMSLVGVPADPGAHVRGALEGDAPTFPCIVQTRGATAMSRTATVPPPPGAPPPAVTPPSPSPTVRTGLERPGDPADPDDAPPPPPADPADPPPPADADDASRATVAERTRGDEIRRACRAAQLPETFADRLVTQGTPIHDARTAVLAELARRQAPVSRTVIDTSGGDGLERMHRGVTNMLLNRVAPSSYPLDDAGREWRSYSLLEIGRKLLEARGLRTRGMGKLELAAACLGLAPSSMLREGPHGFLATSDFPTLLATVGRATLTQGYNAAGQTFPPWTRQTTLPDFRATNRVALGTGPKLLKVSEHEEYTRANLGLVPAASIKLDTFGRILAFTRQALVNDDVGLFQRIPQVFGNAAAQMESDAIYTATLLANPLMADGFALFSTQHGNLMTAAAITVASVAAARTAMMTQKSPDGSFIGVRPQFLIVGPQQEVYALQFLAPLSIVGAINAVVPDAYKSLKLIVEPRITGLDWYLAADPAQIDTIEYAYLEGAPSGGPLLETREGWDIDGQEYKAREDFGVAAIDYRGLVKNPGALPAGLLLEGAPQAASAAAGGGSSRSHKE